MNEKDPYEAINAELLNKEMNPNDYNTIQVDVPGEMPMDEIDKEDALIPIEEIRVAGELELYLDSWEAFDYIDEQTLAEALVDDPEELDALGQSLAFIVDQINKLTDEERTGYHFEPLFKTYQNLLAVTDNAFTLEKYGSPTKSFDLELPTLEDFKAAGQLPEFLTFCQQHDLVTTEDLAEMLATEQVELLEMTYATVEHYLNELDKLSLTEAEGYQFETLKQSKTNLDDFMNNVRNRKN